MGSRDNPHTVQGSVKLGIGPSYSMRKHTVRTSRPSGIAALHTLSTTAFAAATVSRVLVPTATDRTSASEGKSASSGQIPDVHRHRNGAKCWMAAWQPRFCPRLADFYPSSRRKRG